MNRWQLARAGILNVYQYENETLEFRGGRLLLRGINGSGKSTAMNMLLPFLLTGRTRGIDAAGEQSGLLKAWMLSGRDEAQPVGYLWIEFARGGEPLADGDAVDGKRVEVEHLVIGCGIKANRASDTFTTWWFVTRRRPGVDLQLIEHGVPLSAEGLRVALDADPVFPHDRRADYRREVAKRLYGGADNEPWLALLDTVRNPRVGDRIDRDLPEHLTHSLPTLSETALIEAARPLDDLDEHRRNVADLSKTDEALRAIGDVYHHYALGVLHRESDDARAVLKRANERLRDERQEIAAHEAAVEAARLAGERVAELKRSMQHLDDEVRALRDSSAYTEGRQLDDLRTAVAELARRLLRQRADVTATTEQRQRDALDVGRRQHQCDSDRQKLTGELADIATAVSRWTLPVRVPTQPAVVAQTLSCAGDAIDAPAQRFDASIIDAALSETAVAALARVGDIDEVLRLNAALVELDESVRAARTKLELAEQDVFEGEAALVEAREALLVACDAWDASIAAWSEAVTASIANQTLSNEWQERWRSLVDTEVRIERPARRGAFDDVLDAWQDECRRLLLLREADETQAREAEADAQHLLDALLAQRQPTLPRPDWQRVEGVAFADVVEFQAHVDDRGRARLEAALQASGLLSAAIVRGGARLGNGELVATGSERVTSPLADLLEPIASSDMPDGVDVDAVSRLLGAISTDPDAAADTVISIDGGFRLGRLRGRHEKPLAEHVGVGARRAALERQRTAAKTALAEAAARVSVAVCAHAEARSALDSCLDHRRALPSLGSIESADAAVQAADTHWLRAQERARASSEVVALLDRRLAAAIDERDRQARTHRLPSDAAALQEAKRSLDELKRDTHSASRSVATLARSVGDWYDAARRWQTSATRLEEQRGQLAEDSAHHDGQRTRLDALEATLGSAYRDVVAIIETQERALGDARTSMPLAEDERDRKVVARAAAEAARGQAIEAYRVAEHDCERRHAHLNEVADVHGLIDIVRSADQPTAAAVPAGDASDTHSDGAASGAADASFASRFRAMLRESSADRAGLAQLLRALSQALPQHPDSPTVSADGVRLSMRQRRAALGAGWDAENHQPDAALPLALSVNGPLGRFSLADALIEVGTQLRQMRALLSEKQDQALRTLLHGQLAGDVAQKLHQAKTLIVRMNERLGSVTSSHGIGVRLRWRRDPELDVATSRMVDILEKLPDLRSESEEGELRETLSQRLDEARRLEPDAPYRELIDGVLDYRRWHEMQVLLRRGDDKERPLSRRTPLSEGEKKLVTYLPLFSAVAAGCDALEERASHASGGSRRAGIPRFLLLDDAFAKVSEDNHARLFGLLVQLDLDFIATSERLWGTHATVPALAITEVVRDDTAGVILLEHSRWDGHTLTMTP